MKIKLTNEELIYLKSEKHYKLDVDGKEIWINKWKEEDPQFSVYDGDTAIIKGKELLTDDEIEEVLDFVSELK